MHSIYLLQHLDWKSQVLFSASQTKGTHLYVQVNITAAKEQLHISSRVGATQAKSMEFSAGSSCFQRGFALVATISLAVGNLST